MLLLALKAPQPGKFLSPGPTRPTGHLLLPFFVKQTNCVHPSAILGKKVITTLVAISIGFSVFAEGSTEYVKQEINANDIIISPKVGDDLSQIDECFQKE